MSGDILEASLACLMAHCHPNWGDRDGLDVFNRLLAKNIRPPGWTSNTHLSFQRHQIDSRKEQWHTEDLAKLARGHSDPRGVDFDCPIVIAQYEGLLRVLDGNHRINRWVASADKRKHDVHVHTVQGAAQFVTLPPIDGAS